jgi:integrase
MLIYSGVRISELLDPKKSDVHLNEKWFYVCDSKTNAGIRAVPIANRVLQYYEYWLNKNECEFLLSTREGEHFTYRNYYDGYWVPILKELNLEHKPHDTRHTCISLLATAKVDQTTSLTERVYTHLDISVLIDAINVYIRLRNTSKFLS